MKLAKRVTGRTGIIAFNNSYHGSTQGALSIMGDEYWRNAFRPLLPGIRHLEFNSQEALDHINGDTACVIAETIQAEAGVIAPGATWMQALREKCSETGTLLILDEIQAGFGRTGRRWAFEHYGIVPDVLLLGKALGGGLPLGAFIANRELMMKLSSEPVLGHITTFGGHPLSCAAGLAAMNVLEKEQLAAQAGAKGKLFREKLVHPQIRATRSYGLWMAVEFGDAATCKKVVDACIEKGVLTDWFLFAPQCLRISPPLTVSEQEISSACKVILEACSA
jgi:acetylornithine/succinyldiaminopimelate/putrescine aminotransferase